jgi:hypothetical protein
MVAYCPNPKTYNGVGSDEGIFNSLNRNPHYVCISKSCGDITDVSKISKEHTAKKSQCIDSLRITKNRCKKGDEDRVHPKLTRGETMCVYSNIWSNEYSLTEVKEILKKTEDNLNGGYMKCVSENMKKYEACIQKAKNLRTNNFHCSDEVCEKTSEEEILDLKNIINNAMPCTKRDMTIEISPFVDGYF